MIICRDFLIVDGAVHLCQRQRPDPAKAFWTISGILLCSMPPRTRREMCATVLGCAFDLYYLFAHRKRRKNPGAD